MPAAGAPSAAAGAVRPGRAAGSQAARPSPARLAPVAAHSALRTPTNNIHMQKGRRINNTAFSPRPPGTRGRTPPPCTWRTMADLNISGGLILKPRCFFTYRNEGLSKYMHPCTNQLMCRHL